MTTRWARVARGLIAALVSTFIAVCSHALAGGSLPGTAGILLCLAFSSVICIMLSGRSLSRLRLSIAVGVSQFLFHAAFGLVTAPTIGAGLAGQGAPGAHHSGGMAADMAASLAPLHAAPGAMTMPSDAWMWTGHAVAAVLTIVALRHGESAFWNLLAIAALAVARMLGSVRPVPHISSPLRKANASRPSELPRVQGGFLSIHRHRGPPALAT